MRESGAAELRSEKGCRNGSAVRVTARTPAKASGVEENKRRRRTHNRRGGRSKAPTAPHRGEVEDAAGERPKTYPGSCSTKKGSSQWMTKKCSRLLHEDQDAGISKAAYADRWHTLHAPAAIHFEAPDSLPVHDPVDHTASSDYCESCQKLDRAERLNDGTGFQAAGTSDTVRQQILTRACGTTPT